MNQLYMSINTHHTLPKVLCVIFFFFFVEFLKRGWHPFIVPPLMIPLKTQFRPINRNQYIPQ